ncbi:MAG: glycosyltransferase [Melioribacteraceae bacterium]|nr:glycosyltransferase [Melioribacteraceae bacterium]MCF8263411.1 glycosyltransferase [Melioribacteraceae bacterium]MCF8430409.1 glycosyltransferase [Melioribacteraceae bacterium]
MNNPSISVVLSVLNGEKYLPEAIESVLKQSFTDFEFIIVNDGSTDKTADILKEITDPRVKIITNEQNLGISNSRNIAQNHSMGKYIVVIDADDISVSTRFEEQFTFMEQNPDIDICGSYYDYIDEGTVITRYVSDEEIKIALLEGCAIKHGSSIYRKSSFVKNNLYYNADFIAAQDYELLSRGSSFLKYHNIPKVLYHYRKHDDQISSARKKLMADETDRIKKIEIDKIIIERSEEENDYHNRICRKDFSQIGSKYVQYIDWLNKLENTNAKKKVYNEELFSEFIKRLKSITNKAFSDNEFILTSDYNWRKLYRFFTLEINPYKYYNLTTRFAISLKCLFYIRRTN